MDQEFEDMLKKTAPTSGPDALRESVLKDASAAWDEDNVEHQLKACEPEGPDGGLRRRTLASARQAWRQPKPIRALRRWVLATAAVIAFAVCGAWYDTYQKSFHGDRRAPAPVATTSTTDTELLAAVDLSEDVGFLIGTQSRKSSVSKERSITWRGAREQLLNH